MNFLKLLLRPTRGYNKIMKSLIKPVIYND